MYFTFFTECINKQTMKNLYKITTIEKLLMLWKIKIQFAFQYYLRGWQQ